MTKQEASERYNIPIWLLDEYESWGLCREIKKVMGSWQYDDSDLERLSMIMTLHFKEAQLARLDYLRHSINTKKKI